MEQLDLFVLLKKLSSKEVKEFDAYLKRQSREGTIIRKLFKYLRKHHPQFATEKVSYLKLHQLLFPKKAFKQKIISNYLSDIHIALRKFLVEKHLEAHSYQNDYILLQIYRKYQLDHLFNKQLNSLKSTLEQAPQKDFWHFFKEMQLNQDHYFYMSTKRIVNRQSIQQAMCQLDDFYTAAKLKYSSEIYSGSRILDEAEPDISPIDESAFSDRSLYHQIYTLTLEMIQKQSTDSYYALKTLFLTQYTALCQDDQFTILTYLINFTSYVIKKGDDSFITESFELLKFGVERQHFIIDGVFDPNHFLNTVEAASRSKYFGWGQ